MHSFAQFRFDFLQLRSFPLAHRAPQHREHPVASLLATDVREAKKVECLGLPFSTSLSIVCCIAAKLDDARFLGMQFQVELGEPLRQLRDETARRPPGAQSPPRSHQPSGRQSRRLWLLSCASAAPRGRTHSADRCWPARARHCRLVAFPLHCTVHSPSSSTPAFSHLRMSRTTRWSATRCSMNLISHSWSKPSKNELRSPSSTQFTFLVSRSRCTRHPAHGAASCLAGSHTRNRESQSRRWHSAPRPSARWTILSSNAVTPSGRCRPSVFGDEYSTHRLGSISPAPQPSREVLEIALPASLRTVATFPHLLPEPHHASTRNRLRAMCSGV